MNVKKSLSLLLGYVLLLTVAPVDFLVNQVQAEGKFASNYQNSGIINYNYGTQNYNGNYETENYNLNYLYQSMYIYNVDKDKDSIIVVAGDETKNYDAKKIVKIDTDGTSKTIRTNIINKRDSYIGVKNGKVYYFSQGYNYGFNVNSNYASNYSYNYSYTYSYNYSYNTYDYSGTYGSIKSIDLKSGKEKKEYDVKIPSLKNITYLSLNTNEALQKDGSIIMTLHYNTSFYDKFGGGIYLLTFKNNKESIINLKEKGISYVRGFDIDSKGNIWTSSPENYSLVKIDKKNNISTYKVNMPNEYGFSYGGFTIDNEDNIWATVYEQDSLKWTYNIGVMKFSIKGEKVTSKSYGSDKGVTRARRIDIDKNGQVWIMDSGSVKKLEKDEFVTKYRLNIEYPLDFSIIDDSHFLVADYDGYMYINQ